jgi:hypothetical protein
VTCVIVLHSALEIYETIAFEAVGDVTNAESQRLAVVRYQQIVRRKSNDKVFHDQTR